MDPFPFLIFFLTWACDITLAFKCCFTPTSKVFLRILWSKREHMETYAQGRSHHFTSEVDRNVKYNSSFFFWHLSNWQIFFLSLALNWLRNQIHCWAITCNLYFIFFPVFFWWQFYDYYKHLCFKSWWILYNVKNMFLHCIKSVYDIFLLRFLQNARSVWVLD